MTLRIDLSGGPSIDEIRNRVKATTIHKLSSTENPLGPSPRVIEILRDAAATLHEYPPRGDDHLREAIANHHARGLTPDHVASANGGYEVIDLIGRAFLRPGDEVIISSPTYRAYAWSAARQEATIVDVRLRPDDFSLDVDGILAALTERTRLVCLCNPGNPSGSIAPRADVERLLAHLPARTILVADEVYVHYVDDARYPDSIRHVLDNQPVVIVHSLSKAYGLAGLRVGYGIGRPDLIARVAAYRRPFHLSTLALRAAVAAIQDTEHLDRSVALARAGRRHLRQQLDRLGVTHWPSQGNFVLFRTETPARQAYEQLLERGIMVRPTDSNGLPDHLRVSAGRPDANEAFIEALAAIERDDRPGRA